MQRRNFNSQFIRNAKLQGWLESIEFFLIDVGASGGIDEFWRQFQPQFRAVGFDPLIREVERRIRSKLTQKSAMRLLGSEIQGLN
jgi:hypothetical protein